MNYEQAKRRAVVLKAVAHPVRVLIVEALQSGERCVCDLNRIAKINQSNFSRHLAVLKHAGIVADRRVGMKVFYRLVTPCVLNALNCAVQVIESDTQRRLTLVRSV